MFEEASFPKTETPETGKSLRNERSQRVIDLVVSDSNELATKGLYRRETHSKSSEHAFLAYNEHRDQDLNGECFVWIASTTENYRWDEHEGPEPIYPDKLERIDQIIGFFRPLPEKKSAEETVG